MIVEEYNVFGDGVNIAAQLEQLADPGGIVLSEAVYQRVKGRSHLPIVEMGTRTLKNIDQPIKLYRIGPDALGGAPTRQTDRGSDARLKIRDAIVSAVDEIAREVKDVKQGEGLEGSEVDEQRIAAVAAVFSPGTLALTAIGVLLVLARTSGWSDNAWYPFLGVWVLGIAAGRLVKGVSGRGGLFLLMQSIGLGIGAAFFGNVVVQATLWVIAAAMLGSSIQALRRS